MLAEHQLPTGRGLTMLARLLFASLFLISGVTHFTNIPYYTALMPPDVPFSLFLILVSGLVELAGALMIIFNWRPRLGGWLILLFLIPVTIVVHGYGVFTAVEEADRLNQQAHFLKGIALMGAALLITQTGGSVRIEPRAD